MKESKIEEVLEEYRQQLHKEIVEGTMDCSCRSHVPGGFSYCRTDGRALARLAEVKALGREP
jgi:hypothetical protein